jgi:ABC-type uncharacterized transport system auxiliary subunit
MKPIPALRSRAALAVTLAAFAAGCSLTRPAPVKQQFLLDPPAPPAAATPHPASLRVGKVNVAEPYRGKQFVYRMEERRFEVDYYAEFLVAPGPMIAETTARALDQARTFARVQFPGAPPEADYELEGFVGALYADARDAAKPVAELAITYYAGRTDRYAGMPSWSKEYRRSVPLSATTPDAYAAALNTAYGEILAELARDLAVAPFPKKP